MGPLWLERKNLAPRLNRVGVATRASMGPLWLERKNAKVPAVLTVITPRFNGAALVGAEEPDPARRIAAGYSRFNGAALVGAEEPRKLAVVGEQLDASMGPLWLERKNSQT